MKNKRIAIKIKECFYLLILALIITNLAILLNIPFLRQILGFLFLTLLPGLLILQILKLKTGFLEKFILAWGISISFLFFFGLLINHLWHRLGYEAPLATISLLIPFNVAFIILAIIGYKRNKKSSFSLPNLNLTIAEKAFLIVPIFFPALSIFGMRVMNTTDNNIVLMLLLFLIPTYVAFVCFFNQKFPKRLYPIVIFLISISLLLLMSLRSNHIIGMDVHTEYYLFQKTLDNQHWHIFGYSALDACLSITLLPTIYQSILNTSREFLFKILYAVLFSIVPLVIYVISKKYVGEFYGFLASFFFMSQTIFLFAPANPRTFIAILFFAIALMTLFNDGIDPLEKRVLFIVFMASCLVSHYSTTYIFFFIMLGIFLVMEILPKKYSFKKEISLTLVVLFFSLIFFWYSQVVETAFNAGVKFIGDTFNDLNMFFVEESRSETITKQLVGKELAYPVLSRACLAFTWGTFILIGIGVLTMIKRYKEMIAIPDVKLKKPEFLKSKFEMEYLVVAVICSGLLVIMIALPHLSTGYGINRLYMLMLVSLSVCFVMGGMMLAKYFKLRPYLIILLVMIPHFLFVTGAMYQICGVPSSLTLNSEGEHYDVYYIHDQESFAGGWMGKYIAHNTWIGTDSRGALKVEDRVNRDTTHFYCYSLAKPGDIYGYIYLRRRNIIEGKWLDTSNTYNLIDYSDTFAVRNKIYGNGGSEVWR